MAKVTCSTCGLIQTPPSDAACVGCGMPVTVDVREQLPVMQPPKVLRTMEHVDAKLAELVRKRPRPGGWLTRPLGFLLLVLLVVGSLAASFWVQRLLAR